MTAKERKQTAEENMNETVHAINGSDNIEQALKSHGYHSLSKISSTLQGGVFKVKMVGPDDAKTATTNKLIESDSNEQDVVIKVTNKTLHEKSIALIEGKEYPVQENIIDETHILKWLNRHDPPPALTKLIDSFQDQYHIYLVMENGGMNFLDFVAECHRLIQCKKLSITEWQRVSRILFKQMVEFVDWLHTKMGICHLDISLENLLITDIFVYTDRALKGEQIYFSDQLQIKFCDFGLAKKFDGKDFCCHKYVGKAAYKSPEVYKQKSTFDARAADIWSLGICLFMMIIGGAPFTCPSKLEYGFNLIMEGRLSELADRWNRLHYLCDSMIDLLNKIFKKEDKRIKIKDICNHPWLQPIAFSKFMFLS